MDLNHGFSSGGADSELDGGNYRMLGPGIHQVTGQRRDPARDAKSF